MCFSATASFVASAMLLSASAYILQTSRPLSVPTVITAAIPLIFSIQQATEGMVWIALNNGNQGLANTFGIVYIFFAYFFWAAFTPFFGLVNEPAGIRRHILSVVSIIGVCFGVFLYFPIIMRYVPLHPMIKGHSISYIHENYYSAIPFTMDFALYLAICPLSLLISSHKCIRELSGIVVLAFIVSYIFFYYSLTSVWCFFAAIIALGVIIIEKHLNQLRRIAA